LWSDPENAVTPIHRSMTGAEWAMLLTLSVLWGGSFFFVGIVLHELPPLTLVLLRVGIATVILNLVLRVLDVPLPRQPRVWRALFGMALLNNVVPFSLFAWSQTHIASGLAWILNATTPLFGVVVAHCFTTDERMTGPKLAGVVIGFAGTVIMIGPAALQGVGIDVVAQLACLVAALAYALSGVYGRRFKAMGVAPLATATGQLTAAALMIAPVALLSDRPWTLSMPAAGTWAAVVGLATFSTALGYVLYFGILAGAGATNLLLVTFLIPVSAILLGWLFLAETLALGHLGGMALIGLGLVAIDGRLLRPWRRPEPTAVYQGRDI
jgi:drug/metabolite transporter (DMT)-like permease